MHACMYTGMHACIHVCMCMYACMVYASVYACTHVIPCLKKYGCNFELSYVCMLHDLLSAI